MVAFVASLIGLVVGVAIVVVVMLRRPVDAPLTWGEAMVAATYAFFLMFFAYGVVPHQWLDWADNDLKWRSDRILLDTAPIDVTYEALRDTIAAVIYVILLGGQIALWAIWQNRGKAKPAELPTSSYGRPLVKRG